MAPVTIDLTSDDESPTKTAQSVLQSFLPRKEKSQVDANGKSKNDGRASLGEVGQGLLGSVRGDSRGRRPEKKQKLSHGDAYQRLSEPRAQFEEVPRLIHAPSQERTVLSDTRGATPQLGQSVTATPERRTVDYDRFRLQEAARRGSSRSLFTPSNPGRPYEALRRPSELSQTPKKRTVIAAPGIAIVELLSDEEGEPDLRERSVYASRPSYGSVPRPDAQVSENAGRDAFLDRYGQLQRSANLEADDIRIGPAQQQASLSYPSGDSPQRHETMLMVRPTGTSDRMNMTPTVPTSIVQSTTSHGTPYTAGDDALLARLKEVDKLDWHQIVPYFNGRTKGSLQTRYCNKVRGKGLGRNLEDTQNLSQPILQPPPPIVTAQVQRDLGHVDTASNFKVSRDPEDARRRSYGSVPQFRDTDSANYETHQTPIEASALEAMGHRTHDTPTPPAVLSSVPHQSSTPGRPTPGKDLEPHPTAGSHRSAPASTRGNYTAEEDALLARLKRVDNLSWDEIMPYFPGRTRGSLQVRLSTKLKDPAKAPRIADFRHPKVPPVAPRVVRPVVLPSLLVHADSVSESSTKPRPQRQRRSGGPSALDGFVSWIDVKENRLIDPEPESQETAKVARSTIVVESGPLVRQDRIFPSNLARRVRHREMGVTTRRGWGVAVNGIADELKNLAIRDHKPRKHFERTCGDVTCLSWTFDGARFAAGSIAISDDRSMQYNSNLNLLIGESETGKLQELSEHHVPRPSIEDDGNVNALHSMRASQDPRLFMTVAAVAFSPDGKQMYSAGSDGMMRAYSIGEDVRATKCLYEIQHPAALDILSVNKDGLLASACHTSEDGCVRVIHGAPDTFSVEYVLSPSRTDNGSALPLYPTTLRWGIAKQHQQLLLAGFSSDSINDDRDTAGETALWNVQTEQRLSLSTVTRNVFDVAWNPAPSSGSTAFAVASTPATGKSHWTRRSIVQCYAPEQNRARQVLELECPAFDINDLTYCPFDDNLIAAGATDGKVYVWDMRFANSTQGPLHELAHGDSVNVLDHDRDRELTDTGVRFLSWGATGSRLYSGSSDGVVKVWNPYRSADNAHVDDAATFKTAIMSGAFNHDYQELLIGEECGRLNLLSMGHDDEDGVSLPSSAFKLYNAPGPETSKEPLFAAAHELLDTGQIELRPMGDLPTRQAVQGPNYRGPYFDAPPGALETARANLQRAQTDPFDSAEGATKIWNQLNSRHEAWLSLSSQAARTQQAFLAAEQSRLELQHEHPTEPCTLKCTYLPNDTDGITDCHRSEQRIPHAVQCRPPSRDLHALNCQQLFEAGLAGPCPHCATGKKTPSSVLQDIFCRQRRTAIRADFTATCESCAAPVRSGETYCQACCFTCFRCGECDLQPRAGAEDEGVRLYCPRCEVAWIPGVLGFETVPRSARSRQTDGGFGTELGGEDTELMYYHSRWQ